MAENEVSPDAAPDPLSEPPQPVGVQPAVQFAVLASGSSGNSALVRGDGPGLLIDAGLGPRALDERLASVGAALSGIAAVVLTHTHGDHVQSSTFAELARRRCVVHCHEAHRTTLAADPGFQRLEQAGLVSCFEDERPFLTAAGARLEPFALRHDGGPTFGFRIELAPRRRTRPVSIGYLADTGCWSDRMADHLADVDVLGVEFNHDEEMQKTSGRPWVLIRRNLGDGGHLSNRQGAELVAEVLRRSRGAALRHLVLLHLSRQCNRPGLAIDAARAVVREAGRRVVVHAARQEPAHPNLRISPARRPARSSAQRPLSPRTHEGRSRPDRSPVLAGLFASDEPGSGAGPAGAN